MRKWIEEDWEFTVTVTEGRAEQCRLGRPGAVSAVSQKAGRLKGMRFA